MRSLATLVAIAWALAAGAAQADFLARNGMLAADSPARPGYFEVYQRALAGAPDYWCTAGEYARYAKHLQSTTPLYIVRGLGPSLAGRGRAAVIFSYVRYDDIPDLSGAGQGYSVSDSKPGYTLSAGHGTAFCQDSVKKFRSFGFR